MLDMRCSAALVGQGRLCHGPSICGQARGRLFHHIKCRHGMYAINSAHSISQPLPRSSGPPRAPLKQRCAPCRTCVTSAAAASQNAVAASAQPWDQDWDAMGPAFKATLGLLEWPAFCEHLADFASTSVGKRLCRQLDVPMDQATSERLLEETRWVGVGWGLMFWCVSGCGWWAGWEWRVGIWQVGGLGVLVGCIGRWLDWQVGSLSGWMGRRVVDDLAHGNRCMDSQ